MISFCDLLSLDRDIERGAPSMLETLRGGHCVFLSPHYDDVAFSLGMTAREIGRGTLVNLFTRSINLPNAGIKGDRRWSLEEISALRDAEDARFAAACGLTRINLNLDEPPVRGRHSKDLAGLDEDRAQLREPLARALVGIVEASGTDPLTLFCPAAIGRHVSHTATMLTVAELLPTLRPRWRVFFYEELPYASSFWRRQIGLARLGQACRTPLGIRHTLRLKDRASDKLALVALYESQQRHAPRAARYSPGVFLSPDMHEAFWEPGV